jgi:hypothetical protein
MHHQSSTSEPEVIEYTKTDPPLRIQNGKPVLELPVITPGTEQSSNGSSSVRVLSSSTSEPEVIEYTKTDPPLRIQNGKPVLEVPGMTPGTEQSSNGSSSVRFLRSSLILH